MAPMTIVSDETREIEAEVVDGRVLVTTDALPDALGWTLKPEGLCRDDTCVPVRDPATMFVGELLDLAAVAEALDREMVVDADAGIVAVALDREQRHTALRALTAPDVALRDLDGEEHKLSDWHGQKRLLHAFSSWCGCRYDLPGWQALHDELSDENFSVIAVAIDESPDDVKPFTEGVTMPVLIDPQHVLTELYAISNVPAVVWIDEDDHIVRPNGVAFSNDMFKEFTGAESGPHLDALRAWVHDGTAPMSQDEAREAVPDLSDDEVRARLHFRVAVEARRRGEDDVARRHFVRAGELAPMDFTVRRAAMPLMGEDPFGPDFMALFDEWQAAGSPFHGLPPMNTTELTYPEGSDVAASTSSDPTGFVGMLPLRNKASSASTARTASVTRRPVDARRRRSRRRPPSAVAGGTPGVVERLVEIGVGDEGHAAGELGLRLRREVVRAPRGCSRSRRRTRR